MQHTQSKVNTLLSRKAFLLLMEFFNFDNSINDFYKFLSSTKYSIQDIKEPYNELIKAGFIKGELVTW